MSPPCDPGHGKLTRMTEYAKQEIERLHEELASIYRRGALTSTEQLQTEGLWARIERQEAELIKAIAREERAK
jgi:hypothetical protein